ncbi:MAG: metallophosphoesterase [Gemmatimonadales bacterium]
MTAAALAGSLGMLACARGLLPGEKPEAAIALEQLETRLFLIGDAGKPAPGGEPVLAELSRQIAAEPAKSFVLFLGDNVYPYGMAPKGAPRRAQDERRLSAQLDVLLRNRVSGILLPGNHDWAKHTAGGKAAILAQEEFVREHVDSFSRAAGFPRAYADSGLVLLPGRACPGPAVRDLGRYLRLLILDTQWWLHPRKHPRSGEGECPRDGTERQVEDSIAAALSTAGDRDVVVAAHHPMLSGGEHGGFFDWRTHLFPLTAVRRWFLVPFPVLGSIVPLSRMGGYSPQDLSGPQNCRMRAGFDSAFAAHRPLLYAAGHDHGLQVLRGGGGRYSVVSGGGVYGHTGPVTRGLNTLLAMRASGFMRLDVMAGTGRERLSVFTVNASGSGREVYTLWLDKTKPPPDSPHLTCLTSAPEIAGGERGLRNP